MNLNIDSLLLERMFEGVIFLNGKGQITDFNRASRPWLKCCASVVPQLDQLIKQVAKGAISAPVNVTESFPPWTSADPVDVYLYKSDPLGYALVFLPLLRQATAPVSNGSGKGNVFTLLGEEIRHEMTILRGQLANATQGHTPDANTVIRQSDRLSRLLVAMDQLSQLSCVDALFQGSRLSLIDLIDEVLIEIPRPKGGYLVDPELGDIPAKPGVLYGDAGWLKCALRGLFEGIGEGAPPASQIQLRVRQSGGFVVLKGDFAKSAPVKRAARLKSVAPLTTSLRTDADTRLPICRRVVELHGGQLEITQMHNDNADEHPTGFDAFTVTLPLGNSAQANSQSGCASCRFSEQAEWYARDMASLMPPRLVSADISQEVFDFRKETATERVSDLPLESLN